MLGRIVTGTTIMAAALLSGGAVAAPHTEYSWRCDFPTVQVCLPTGCDTVAPAKDNATWVFLYPTGGNYFRCSGEGEGLEDCDRYTARVSDSGAYKIFELPGSAAFIKIADDLNATEVITLMDNVFIERGRCQSAPPLVRTNP